MKITLVFVVIAAVAVVSVRATSPPNCAAVTCDPSTCPAAECTCGSHKDYCGCCDYCDTCPNEECTRLFRDPCSEGHHCVLDNPEERFETGGKGHCRPRPDAEAGHSHHG
uniref:Putative insulin-like growth factor binding protein-related protein 6 long n=1 Tax=Amblyomma americanum TaxID=6943 RepID=A0A0C9RW50_AMBAM